MTRTQKNRAASERRTGFQKKGRAQEAGAASRHLPPTPPRGFSISVAVLSYRGCHQATDWCSALVAGVENEEKAEERRKEEAEPWEGIQPPRASTCNQPIRDYEGLLKVQTWRRAWQPTPVFLPGESHGRRSPARYSP
ncbi:hypothetical protein R6Z07M_000645 [Ovis aries]